MSRISVMTIVLATAFPGSARAQCPLTSIHQVDNPLWLVSFGRAISLDQKRVVFGAAADSPTEPGTGSALVYRRVGSAWQAEAQLWAADGHREDAMGVSAAISGDSILLGAIWADNAAGIRSGAAYLFEREDKGTWWESQKLSDGQLHEGAFFGQTAAMTPEFAIVGSPDFIDPGHGGTGAVYVYEPDADGEWLETARLLASDRSGGDR